MWTTIKRLAKAGDPVGLKLFTEYRWGKPVQALEIASQDQDDLADCGLTEDNILHWARETLRAHEYRIERQERSKAAAVGRRWPLSRSGARGSRKGCRMSSDNGNVVLAVPEKNAGGLGDRSVWSAGTRDVRLAERAVRECWLLRDDARAAMMARLEAVVLDPGSKPRAFYAAVKAAGWLVENQPGGSGRGDSSTPI